MIPERRGQERIQAAVEIAVTHADTHAPIGKLSNLSVDGFMMISNERLEEGQQLAVTLSPVAKAAVSKLREPIEVTIECLWADVQTGGACWSGGHFIDVSPQEIIAIASLVAAFEQSMDC